MIKRVLMLAIALLFFAACAAPVGEEIATTTEQTTTTQQPTTTAWYAAIAPIPPSNLDNLLVGMWLTQEGGGVFTREGRGFAVLEFFEDNTGEQECGYNGFDLRWRVQDETLTLALYTIHGEFWQENIYAMELGERTMRLNGVLFTRVR